MTFGIDAKQMLHIYDAPFKGCTNLASNCLFLSSFDVNEEDNVLLGELLPYIKSLYHANDTLTITSSSLYGKEPIVQGRDPYSCVHMVIAEWEERNLIYLGRSYYMIRLPKDPWPLHGEKDAASNTNGMST